MFVLHGAAPFRTRAPEANKKSPRPHRAFTLQGREPENFRGTTLFYRTLTGHGLEAAAVGAELGSHGVQPDALTGVPVAGLALLCFAHAAPRPFSVPCFLPFSTVRALW